MTSRRRFLFWGFKSPHDMLHKSLGALERDILAICWEHANVNVRVACSHLETPVAYTTVMTTMDRLFKKGLLSRRKVGRAFVYNAAASREELEGSVASELVQSLFTSDRSESLPILSTLVDAVSERDRALLDDLERLIREKRRALKEDSSS
jgi:predicted transcriptional regulator